MHRSSTSTRRLVAAWRYTFRGLLVILGVATVLNVSRDVRLVVAGLLVAMVLAEACNVVVSKCR